MTNLISEVKEALQAATPGPWKWVPGNEMNEDVGEFQGKDEERICNFGNWTAYYPTCGDEPSGSDIRLIENAPTWLQQLVDRVEAETNENAVLHNLLMEAVKALEWYADKKVWTVDVQDQWQPFTQIGADGGELARTTLKRIKGDS